MLLLANASLAKTKGETLRKDKEERDCFGWLAAASQRQDGTDCFVAALLAMTSKRESGKDKKGVPRNDAKEGVWHYIVWREKRAVTPD